MGYYFFGVQSRCKICQSLTLCWHELYERGQEKLNFVNFEIVICSLCDIIQIFFLNYQCVLSKKILVEWNLLLLPKYSLGLTLTKMSNVLSNPENFLLYVFLFSTFLQFQNVTLMMFMTLVVAFLVNYLNNGRYLVWDGWMRINIQFPHNPHPFLSETNWCHTSPFFTKNVSVTIFNHYELFILLSFCILISYSLFNLNYAFLHCILSPYSCWKI